ncbi:MAG: ABC transporter ATP-binding protein [Acidobacteriota bacterium]|nr:ABC transporter ATP-binding protein/permease [Blastocatellia bacterium]MDW8238624.1 ABC transporter ATP-binding protein [Acidobacteriota bacterium]
MSVSPALKRLLTYHRRHRRALILGLICIFVGNAIGITAPMVVRDAVNELTLKVTARTLLMYALLVVGIKLVQGVFLFFQRWILVGMSRDIEYELRNDLFAHWLTLDMQFYHEHRTGDLMARATNDLNAVRMMAGPAVLYGLQTLSIFVLALPLMIRINGLLTVLALISLPLVFVATKYFGQRIHERFEKIQEFFSMMSAKAQENLSGVRVVRAFVQEEHEIKQFRQLNAEYVRRNMSLIKLSGMFYPLLQALIGLGFVSVLWYGGHLTLNGAITVGEFIEFNLYMGQLIWPMIALGFVVNLVQRGMASMERLDQIFNRLPLIQDAPDAIDVPLEGKVEFRNLTFSYNGREPVLKNINLTIEPGETVAIVGRTGSGKTTLLDLVTRLVDPPPGQLFIDEIDSRQLKLERLRASIGVVPQEPFLFGLTLKDNIAFGAPGALMEEIERAAVIAGLDGDIADFPNGYDTLVGERGITLSGGQKQRTAIARAVIRRPELLILDDALSSVDTQTEERILHHLRDVMRDRTCIIVSHRLSAVKDADKIIVLDHGRIVERGTHDELLARGGLYADLYEKQMLEEELAASD